MASLSGLLSSHRPTPYQSHRSAVSAISLGYPALPAIDLPRSLQALLGGLDKLSSLKGNVLAKAGGVGMARWVLLVWRKKIQSRTCQHIRPAYTGVQVTG